MTRCIGTVATLVLLTGVTLSGNGQSSPATLSQDRTPFAPLSGRTKDRDHDEVNAHVEQQQARSRNADRQKRLVEDTNKLLSLATELKTQVDKTDKNMLSIDVIKKAEEIEKLAHSVKERMKG